MPALQASLDGGGVGQTIEPQRGLWVAGATRSGSQFSEVLHFKLNPPDVCSYRSYQPLF
jgi:hypothetical protein